MIYDNERIDYLNDHTQIIQSDDVFSFSTDALLLAHFTHCPKTGLIVDLCAGNGAIGLKLATKTQSHITMIELQSRLADMAKRSIALNHYQSQIDVITTPLHLSLQYIHHDSVDTIVCNPPYFKYNKNNKTNPNPYLALARHELTTNLDEIMHTANRLLKTKGHIFMVHRPERLLDIIHAMEKHQIAPKRLQFVHPYASKEANTVLIEGIKQGRTNGLTCLPPFIIYQSNHHYTEEMERILHE